MEHPDHTPTDAYRQKQREDPVLRERMKQRGEWVGLVKQQRQQDKLHPWGLIPVMTSATCASRTRRLKVLNVSREVSCGSHVLSAGELEPLTLSRPNLVRKVAKHLSMLKPERL